MPITEVVIRDKLVCGQVDLTVHAVFEAAEDLLFVHEIEAALSGGEIIENDEGRSRCLMCAPLDADGYIHVIVDYSDWQSDPDANILVVTVYRPDPSNWIDGRVRRP